MPDILTSTGNPLVKELAQLHDSRQRAAQRLFLVEGRRAIDGCLEGGWSPRHLLVRDDAAVPEQWSSLPVRRMGARVAERLSQASTPSGYVAAFPLPVVPALDRNEGGLVLCGLSDPGNVGTVLRTAAAFAIRQVVVVGGCDIFNHKVVQAAAGNLPRLAVHQWQADVDTKALLGGAPRCALVVSGGQPPSAFTPGPRWLVVGGEAEGLSTTWINACEEQLTLPMPGQAESLNAAVACAIASYLLLCRE